MDNNEIVSLSSRKKQILFSAVDNYIKQASPITSLLVQQTEMSNFSTATLRNELSTLEAMGYLKQLHTSSGRVPTTKGYRFFVNEIVTKTNCSVKQLNTIKKDLFDRTGNLNEIIKTIADTISSTTNYPAVVVLDGFENLLLQTITIMQLINGQLLVLIDTNAGVITNTIKIDKEVKKQDCDNASKIFTDIFSGKTIGFLMHNIDSFSDTIQEQMKQYEEIFNLVLFVLQHYSCSGTSQGITKLLNSPEYNNIEKAKNILNILDDDSKLKDIFDTSDKDGVTIKIGDENELDELSSCAVIKTPVVLDGNKIATIGVIGPQRIDYATVASVLKVIADEINKGR